VRRYSPSLTVAAYALAVAVVGASVTLLIAFLIVEALAVAVYTADMTRTLRGRR
jgi:hypothetical protein